MHFVALFSEKEDAKPIAFLHGWPGSFLEFLPLLSLFREKYEPTTLPYHLIVPSLPGYTFSSDLPADRDFTSPDAARILNQLMVNLGFGNGYVVQGGDVGSKIGRILGAKYDSCKAVHLNFAGKLNPPKDATEDLSAVEQEGLKRAQWFGTYGTAYYFDHATRPSTISHILSTNPVALLIWIGERFRDWPDKRNPVPLRTILQEVTLYWLTDTFPRSIYTYRETYPPPPVPPAQQPDQYIHKPFGFSYFPQEVIPAPRSWVERTGNLVFWKEHTKGGHFAALECPQELADDIVEFVEQVWQQ
ncbi:epoxide hydrolase, putative [Talaromyces stipitatus ATCC 10500]|nr:epoxide hydrolase, putative [Talaromyces stipitatus ATCC 10500]EED23533.1 epoxide hydrolase, putative [Talaromyces stipitatus ATCC 10500]